MNCPAACRGAVHHLLKVVLQRGLFLIDDGFDSIHIDTGAY